MRYSADRLKALICIEDTIKKYGYEPNRAGFIICPFHNENTPSLKLYPESQSWYCFGCGEGGSIIDFVMKLYDLDFKAACQRLAYDFGLSYELEELEIDKSLIYKRKAAAHRLAYEKQQRQNGILKKADELRHAYEMMMKNEPKSIEEEPTEEFAKWRRKVAELEERGIEF